MKTATSVLIALLAAGLMASTAIAQHPTKSGPRKSLATQADFEALKPGDQLVLVCKTSDSIEIIDVKDEKHALQLCEDGEMVHCPECRKEYTVRRGGHPAGKGARALRSKVVIVNEAGEPCMFYAKLN